MIPVDKIGAATLYRGPRPTLDELKLVKFDINLEVGWFEWFHGEAEEERRWCTFQNVAYLHRPMSDVFPPSRQELISIAKQAHIWLQKGASVLIHCLHGEDRTGLAIATYQILFLGYAKEHAIEEMYAQGFHRFPYRFWVAVLDTISPSP